MKNKYYFLYLLIIGLNFLPVFVFNAQSQTDSKTDYDTLNNIIPIIATYKRDILFRPRPAIPTGTGAPVVLNPTVPIAITTAPSAPGKYPLVRWLLPGGPPPAQTPNLPLLT